MLHSWKGSELDLRFCYCQSPGSSCLSRAALWTAWRDCSLMYSLRGSVLWWVPRASFLGVGIYQSLGAGGALAVVTKTWKVPSSGHASSPHRFPDQRTKQCWTYIYPHLLSFPPFPVCFSSQGQKESFAFSERVLTAMEKRRQVCICLFLLQWKIDRRKIIRNKINEWKQKDIFLPNHFILFSF